MGTRNWTPEPAPERFGQVPRTRGVVFICNKCARPTATTRDAVLKAWGERGVIADVAAKLKCKWCKHRGMKAALAPHWAGAEFGSPSRIQRLLQIVVTISKGIKHIE